MCFGSSWPVDRFRWILQTEETSFHSLAVLVQYPTILVVDHLLRQTVQHYLCRLVAFEALERRIHQNPELSSDRGATYHVAHTQQLFDRSRSAHLHGVLVEQLISRNVFQRLDRVVLTEILADIQTLVILVLHRLEHCGI